VIQFPYLTQLRQPPVPAVLQAATFSRSASGSMIAAENTDDGLLLRLRDEAVRASSTQLQAIAAAKCLYCAYL
jgi:hypothetical protein